MKLAIVPAASLLTAGLLVLSTACGTPSSTSTSAPAAAKPAGAALPAAPATTSGRKEVALVAGPRHRLEQTDAALQKSDVPAARVAFEAYNGEWNGVEVYVNVRSRALYGEIETHYEAAIAKALEEPKPDPAQILPQLAAMVAQYDEVIKLSDTGPALSPLFEDVAAVRIVRAPLRTVSPALKAGDVAKAKAGFTVFKARLGDVQGLIVARSATVYPEIQAAVEQADKALSASPVDAAQAGPLVDAVTERYNFGVNLLNAAARNADVSMTTFGDQDVQSGAALGAIERDLKASLAAWEAGSYEVAGASAVRAAGARFDLIAGVLQAKGSADAALKKALDGYGAVAGQPGDAGKLRAANKAAVEAVALALQTVDGQFWTDPAFQSAYQKAMAAIV